MRRGLLEIQRSLLTGYRRAQEVALSEERRRSPRFQAATTDALLSWWRGEESHLGPARLVNISLKGALFLAKKAPREMEQASFALPIDRSLRWVPGTAVGVALEASGDYYIRLKFDRTCPDDLFALALGFPLGAKVGEPVAEGVYFSSPTAIAQASGTTVSYDAELAHAAYPDI